MALEICTEQSQQHMDLVCLLVELELADMKAEEHPANVSVNFGFQL